MIWAKEQESIRALNVGIKEDQRMKNETQGERPEQLQPGSERESSTDHADAPAHKKEYLIDIFRGWCKCCGICAAFCPRGCIRMNEDGSPVVVDASRCTGCGWCELHCPDFAISVRARNSEEASGEED
jgi:2-oxoglutarate ferredoxin oxidoreductase subunit delta